MSYLDEVSKKMKKRQLVANNQKNVNNLETRRIRQKHLSNQETQRVSKLRDTVETNNFKGVKNVVGSKPVYADPPLHGNKRASGKIDNGPLLPNRNVTTVDGKQKQEKISYLPKASKRKSLIRTAIRAGTDGTSAQRLTNTNKNSPRYGQAYKVKKAKGGSWHTYDNSFRVFVKSGTKYGATPKRGQTGGTYKFLRSNSA